MADTNNLKPYRIGAFPSIEASIPAYTTSELEKVSASLNQCVVALKALEARLVAGGL